ncbi:hypothetical protein HERIO_683 [Hepatospora eriocheir]|uniref:Uncharacterized protein n=1 Tax=Hepatospora eriocheir TaxID=1081669 RepID=A0A1X0QCD6_9MICR|nr:hypothetical protein HERIO_683 [Hepatospora eriocheir]
MGAFINRILDFGDRFKKNFIIELNNDKELKEKITNNFLVKTLDKSRDMLRNFEFSIFQTTFFNIQYMSRPDFNKPTRCKYDNFITRSYDNYKMLNYIRNNQIVNLMFDLFEYKEIKKVLPDTVERLKEIRSDIMENRDLKEKLIKVRDIRNVSIDNITVKNLKKTIIMSFELSVDLIGKNSKGEFKRFPKNYSCYVNLIKLGNEWVVNSFNFNKF